MAADVVDRVLVVDHSRLGRAPEDVAQLTDLLTRTVKSLVVPGDLQPDAAIPHE